MKFRKKPVIVDAWQWTGSMDTFPFETLVTHRMLSREGDTLQIRTLEGIMVANLGDWVIKGVKGEVYPCKPDIFEMTYEQVTV